jgi:hypothetical protein
MKGGRHTKDTAGSPRRAAALQWSASSLRAGVALAWRSNAIDEDRDDLLLHRAVLGGGDVLAAVRAFWGGARHRSFRASARLFVPVLVLFRVAAASFFVVFLFFFVLLRAASFLWGMRGVLSLHFGLGVFASWYSRLERDGGGVRGVLFGLLFGVKFLRVYPE